MTVYLLWVFEDLCGIFQTEELAQKWVDGEYHRGAWTAGEYASCRIEPCQVVTE